MALNSHVFVEVKTVVGLSRDNAVMRRDFSMAIITSILYSRFKRSLGKLNMDIFRFTNAAKFIEEFHILAYLWKEMFFCCNNNV